MKKTRGGAFGIIRNSEGEVILGLLPFFIASAILISFYQFTDANTACLCKECKTVTKGLATSTANWKHPKRISPVFKQVSEVVLPRARKKLL